MEEELKRIECLIERCNQCKLNACITCDICWSEVQAIEELLTRYKDLVETSIRLSKECVELEEENKKLSKDYYDLGSNYCDLDEKCKNSIPISVIQNKIDELKIDRNAIKNEIEEAKKEKNKEYYADLLSHLRVNWGAIQVLQELLEERNK